MLCRMCCVSEARVRKKSFPCLSFSSAASAAQLIGAIFWLCITFYDLESACCVWGTGYKRLASSCSHLIFRIKIRLMQASVH